MTILTEEKKGLNQTALSKICGVSAQSINNLFRVLRCEEECELPKGLEHLKGLKVEFELGIKFRGILINIEACKDIIRYYYVKGSTTPEGAELISMPYPCPAYYRIPKKNKKKRIRVSQKGLESYYQLKLQKQLGGEIEVKTEAGRIDLLTQTELIEVKEVLSWKSAIGQSLSYSVYYPDHKRRIHLFGVASQEYKRIVEYHCSLHNIRVTYETN